MFDEQNTGFKEAAERHKVDPDKLAKYLSGALPGFVGPVEVLQFKGGQSNPTYKLSTPTRQYVMRSRPGPAANLLPSAHAVDREFRVLQALHGSAVPVAQPFVLCTDESVIGRTFYVMELVQGRVLWDPTLPGVSPEQRTLVYDDMNRVIAALHTIDYQAAGLADFGKPGNYFARQIDRWSTQYRSSQTEHIQAMEDLIQWLPRNMPAEDGLISVVHGDYRLDNLMFHSSEPRVMAVLDWELSTLGHPLADFAYHCMAWRFPREFRGLRGHDLPSAGIPEEEQYVADYCERTGYSIKKSDWSFYHAFNAFRLAGINQGIAKRALNGTAASEMAREVGSSTRPLAELAWSYAAKS